MGAACCIGSMCCTHTFNSKSTKVRSNCLCSCCGASRKVYSRIGYAIFSLIWIVISLVMLNYGGKYLTVLTYFINCSGAGVSNEVCLGISAVYRISFALCLFYAFMFVLCLFRNELTAAINDGAWPLKFLAVLGLYCASFMLSNTFFVHYGTVAMTASFLFLLYEVVLLIDLAYSWNRSWIDNYDSSSVTGQSSTWGIIIIATTAILYGSGLIALFWQLMGSVGWWERTEILSTLMSGIVYTGISVSGWVEGGSLLTCGIMFLFNSFMCGSVVGAGGNTEIVVGLGLLMLVLFYVSGTTVQAHAKDSKRPGTGTGTGAVVSGLTGQVMETRDEYEKVEGGSEGLPEVTQATALYHLLMLFASMYYAMLVTNWGSFSISGTRNEEFASPGLGLGIKLSSQWVATLLFVWSLIAPVIFPDRDFAQSDID